MASPTEGSSPCGRKEHYIPSAAAFASARGRVPHRKRKHFDPNTKQVFVCARTKTKRPSDVQICINCAVGPTLPDPPCLTVGDHNLDRFGWIIHIYKPSSCVEWKSGVGNRRLGFVEYFTVCHPPLRPFVIVIPRCRGID